MSTPLAGRTALVTGAGKRIGRAIARTLAEAGADIVVHVNRSTSEGEQAAEEIRALGRRAVVVQADQRNVPEIQAACERAATELGPVDHLVLSAAIWPHVELDETSQEDFDLALEVNLRGPFFWARFLGPRMRTRGGSITAIADVAHDRPWPASLPYCMAKAGVVSMTYGLARALAPQVRVNAIGPGPILFPPDYPEERKREDVSATLLGREGSPEDIAGAVLYLTTSTNVTGVMLPVDGGYRFGI